MELRVFTHCMHCLDIAIVACLTMLLELDDVQDDVVERAAGLVGTRTSTDVFLHLALNAWDARICSLFSFAISTYCEACSRVFEMLNSLIAVMG
jgi:hypothetical protein